MDLGIAGKRAAVAAASQGLGFGGRGGARRTRAFAVAICGRRRDAVESRGRAHRSRRGADRRRRLDARRRARRSCATRATRSAGSTSSSRTRAARRPATSRSTTVEQYLDAFELNCRVDDRDVLRGGARDARAAVGEGGRDHVDRGAAADPEPDPVEHGPGRAHRLPQDARARGRGRRCDRELVAARAARDRAPHGAARRRRARATWPRRSRPGRIGEAADFGDVAAFLCSEHARVRHRHRARRSTAAPTPACSERAASPRHPPRAIPARTDPRRGGRTRSCAESCGDATRRICHVACPKPRRRRSARAWAASPPPVCSPTTSTA